MKLEFTTENVLFIGWFSRISISKRDQCLRITSRLCSQWLVPSPYYAGLVYTRLLSIELRLDDMTIVLF